MSEKKRLLRKQVTNWGVVILLQEMIYALLRISCILQIRSTCTYIFSQHFHISIKKVRSRLNQKFIEDLHLFLIF